MVEVSDASKIVATTGKTVDKVGVTVGPQFLDLFSRQMYSSPNKAFEELVSNSWDAGAETVYVRVPADLQSPDASVWVLDDGESMDIDGLRLLWSVASSEKRDGPAKSGRQQIGKFGIGKLATYVLANELTYVCKAHDGVIRAVTMNYRRIDEADKKLHIPEMQLDVRELDPSQLGTLFDAVVGGEEIRKLIDAGVPKPPPDPDRDEEFGGEDPPPTARNSTWTLALLTSLKDAGKEMQIGWIRWLLRTALPLGASMTVVFNDAHLASSKTNIPLDEEWVIGPGLGIESIVLDDFTATVTEVAAPYPHVLIEGITGPITGRIRLYAERIAGGKSEDVGFSNGFHVNVLGRVINATDPYFALQNLNHSAWAKFRATVRADGLDGRLAVSREGVREGAEVRITRGFLRALFNKARTAQDAAVLASWPDAGEILAKSWGPVAFESLRRSISERMGAVIGLPPFVDTSGIEDEAAAFAEWKQVAEYQPSELVTEVTLEPLASSEPIVKYELASRKVIVNSNHPFAREHGLSHEQKALLRDALLVDLLTEAYMADIGISEEQLEEIRSYRDRTLRLVAQVYRQNGSTIATMLVHATGHVKGLEAAVGDALEYLGFEVERYGQSGEPEGVAVAPTTPDKKGTAKSYRLTYDAKSSTNGKVKTKDLNIAGLARHRKNYNAKHTLVVAPDYELGALQQECKDNHVTPFRAADLAALLMLSAATGPLDLVMLEQIFNRFDPDEIHEWVEATSGAIAQQERLSLDTFLKVLSDIGFNGPNAVTASVVADRVGKLPGMKTPRTGDVQALARGISMLAPNLIRVTNDEIYLSTSPDQIRAEILKQIADVPANYRYGLDKQLEGAGH